VADVQIARDGEKPWRQASVIGEARRMRHEPQPRFLQQVLGHVAAPAETRQEVEQPRVEFRVDEIECRRVTGAETRHERQLGLPVHAGNNAPVP
jgi:hypothetical protein